MTLLEDFAARGLIYDKTEGVEEIFKEGAVTAYIGFDPSAASLHVGSLLPLMTLARLQRFGHHPIAIAGGGTGLIGDPSGKTKERQLLTKDDVEANLAGIRQQLERFLDFESAENPARVVNNADWLTQISFIDFLRDVGKHFTVNYLLAKEAVKRRLEQEGGLSYTEFSYNLLQAYDFLVLYDRYGCNLQLGGSDQWGNITAGVELVRRLRAGKAHGLVFPLITTSSGVKFGKTEAGAVWLDAALTSPYRFYQFWLNTPDADVVKYLKLFTWLSLEEIGKLEKLVETEPEKRGAQRRLAEEVTRIVHGEDELAKAQRASAVLFGAELDDLEAADIVDIFSDVPSHEQPRADFAGDGLPVLNLFAASGLAASKGEARRLLEGGGAYLNNRRLTDAKRLVTADDLLAGRFVVLRKGAKQFHLVMVS
jgi:tyrosyl-tRNA synthetase